MEAKRLTQCRLKVRWFKVDALAPVFSANTAPVLSAFYAGDCDFFFSVFAQYPVRTLTAPMSRVQLPSVKYVYTVDNKSMIGGYRTLLVMNSVNALLIPLRYLIQV